MNRTSRTLVAAVGSAVGLFLSIAAADPAQAQAQAPANRRPAPRSTAPQATSDTKLQRAGFHHEHPYPSGQNVPKSLPALPQTTPQPTTPAYVPAYTQPTTPLYTYMPQTTTTNFFIPMAAQPMMPMAAAQPMMPMAAQPMAPTAMVPAAGSIASVTNSTVSIPATATRSRVRVRGPGPIASRLARFGERLTTLGRTRIETLQETELAAPVAAQPPGALATISTTATAPVVPSSPTFSAPPQIPEAPPSPQTPVASPQSVPDKHHHF